MAELKSLDDLFKSKIFRIPDYQRGYAWQISHLRDFWEDLINLPDGRSHYTGVLTLKSEEISKKDKEYWLTEDHSDPSYNMYHVVDGQQRLTTFVVFLQAFIDFVKGLPENAGKRDQEIYITDSLSLDVIISQYLYKTPTGGQFRTYKFGYAEDNPSDKYLRCKIFKEGDSESNEDRENFYTLNLKEAKSFFDKELKEIYLKERLDGLREVYEKLTKRFLFNEYVIESELDAFVAFETMNNRGKRLSKLELLKNRLIYLITLYTDDEINFNKREDLRGIINGAWKEVYNQLGQKSKRPLNDDDFLRDHCVMYFQYPEEKGIDYIEFLLDEHFSPQKIHEKKVPEIEGYVDSLKESAVHWFNSHYPDDSDLSDEEKDAINRLNRIEMGYFRPLVMSVLKSEDNSEKKIELFKQIERFIFVVFVLSRSPRNYRDVKFYSAAYEFNLGELTLEGIEEKFKEDPFKSRYFCDYLRRRFDENGKGYYEWPNLYYFLREYEIHLLGQSKHEKMPSWENLLKTEGDEISIEHIFPQTPTDSWKESFADIDEADYRFYIGSIGNLLLLSSSMNSELQNKDFADKKEGYSKGLPSAIKVAKQTEWTPTQIEKRGLRLLDFMEERWDIKFESDEAKKSLLFPGKKDEVESEQSD